MKHKDIVNEYGMTPGAPTPVSAQRMGNTSSQTRPAVAPSPSQAKSVSPTTAPTTSPTARRGVSTAKPKMLSLKAQDVPVNSVVKNKAGKVVGTVVEPIEKTGSRARAPGAPAGNRADAVVIKDPQGKYKVVKGKDALIIDDPRVQQESATVAKLTLENIVTVNNRNYGNSLRLANIENLPLEEQLSLMDLVDGDMLNEAHSIAEAFDAPYPHEWGSDSATENYAYAELPDGNWLKVAFDHDEEEDDVDVSFVRNGTADISGEGDAYRIFATVIAAIREYIAMYAPSKITFSAVKELHTTDHNYDDIVKSGASRIKLYNRMVNTFAAKMGYTASTFDSKSKIVYHLTKTAPAKTDRITEAFDTPYPFTWDLSHLDEFGDQDAIAKLPDGSPLHVMFTYNESDDFTTLEFYRNNSQDVSGEGDAYRIFATVMAAVQQYVKKINPSAIVFSATKEEAPLGEVSSRTKLYNRMVMKYAGQMGYEANIYDQQDAVDYQLIRTAPATAESITEAFDAPYSYSWGDAKYGDAYAHALTPTGDSVYITFDDAGDKGTYVEFSRNGKNNITGQGDAYRIFATVIAAIREYIEDYAPPLIKFVAYKEEDISDAEPVSGKKKSSKDSKATQSGASRIKLYNRMVNSLAAKMGYTASVTPSVDGNVYQLSKTASAPITEGAVPDHNTARMINKLLAKPFPANDIRGQMDAFFAIPDPAMIKAFRQVRATDGDKASLHPVLRKYVKTLHPAVQKSIKLYESRLDELENLEQAKQEIIKGVSNIDTAAKDADIAKKNAELIDKLYTVLNKGSVLDRISGVMPDVLKGEYPQRMIAEIVQQIASAPLTYQERVRFSDNLANNKVIDTKVLLTPGTYTVDQLTYNDPVNRTVFDYLKNYGVGQQMKGPGEHALAILSKDISIKGKGDVTVSGTPVEIKAAVGSSASSGAGRFGEPINMPTREQMIAVISKYPAMKQMLDQHLAKQKSLNVGQFTTMANMANLKPAERTKLAKDVFGAIFGKDATKVITAFNTANADPEAVRLAYAESNFDWYKNGDQGGQWQVLAGISFPGNSVGVLKTGSDLAKVNTYKNSPAIITSGMPIEMLYKFTPKAL